MAITCEGVNKTFILDMTQFTVSDIRRLIKCMNTKIMGQRLEKFVRAFQEFDHFGLRKYWKNTRYIDIDHVISAAKWQCYKNIYDGYFERSGRYKLSNLSEYYLGAKYDNTYKNTDWTVRPLSKREILFAAEEVNLLKRIFLNIKDRIQNTRQKE